MREFLKNAAVVILSTALSLMFGEGLFRIVEGKPLFTFPDFRMAGVIRDQISGVIEYDARLGWRIKPHLSMGDGHLTFTSLDYGIRGNGHGDDQLRPGGILVVGASFTAGSEVSDSQTWPAYLEQLTGRPVLNAGEGGYSADQVIMRAEDLLPLLKAKILVVDLVGDNIIGAGYSYDGYPKPYFTVAGDDLVMHNVPVPRFIPPEKGAEAIKHILGRSLLVDRLMATFFRDYWYTSNATKFVRIDNDEVDVVCHLLGRLKRETDARGIRMLLSFQYGGGYMTAADRPYTEVTLVEECAHSLGIQVADEFADLHALLQHAPDQFQRTYMHESNGLLGHKSPYGNEQFAKMVAAAIALPPTARPVAAESVEAAPEAVDHHNLVPHSESLDGGEVSPASATFARVGTTEVVSTYRITAAGEPGEHYAVVTHLPATPGTATFSLEAHDDGTAGVRLQLLDSKQNGVLADFDLSAGTKTLSRAGMARRLGGGIEREADGWSRLWITTDMAVADAPGVAIIQLMDDRGNSSFPANREAITIRRVQLERAGAPSAYKPTGAPD